MAGTLAAWTGAGEDVVLLNERDALDSSKSVGEFWLAGPWHVFYCRHDPRKPISRFESASERAGWGWYGLLKPSGERTAKLPKDYFNVGPRRDGLGRG